MQAQEQLFGVAEFSVVSQTDPCQRALYHFLSWGCTYTLPAHMYRNMVSPILILKLNNLSKVSSTLIVQMLLRMGMQLLLILVKDASISGSDIIGLSASGSWGDLLSIYIQSSFSDAFKNLWSEFLTRANMQ